MNLQDCIEKKLKKKGYKITKQRKSILEVLLASHHNLLNAQQIYERVLEINPGVNFSTVYRNLEILEDYDIIHRIHTGKGYSNYKLDEVEEHHHHFICKDCGKTEAIDFCPLREMEEQLRSKNFIPTEHHFEIIGYCQKCREKNEGM